MVCDFHSSLGLLGAGPLLGLSPAEANEASNKAMHDRVFKVSRLAEARTASRPAGANTALRCGTPCPPWGFTWLCLQERI